MNKYPLWKYIFLAFVLVMSLVYSAPNLYGDDPSLQISSSTHTPTVELRDQLQKKLAAENLPYKGITLSKRGVLVRFKSTDIQLKAKAVLKKMVGDQYTVASNLAPATPGWLRAFGANPMKLGLDLRGGVHFLLDVDVNSVVAKRENDSVREIGNKLRDERLRYAGIRREKHASLLIKFRDQDTMNKAYKVISSNFPAYTLTKQNVAGDFQILAVMSPASLQQIKQQTIEQTTTILRNRINELGVAEPVVQQQGASRISVDLPGVQDSARAQRILGGTATIELHMVDSKHDARSVIGGVAPIGSRLYKMNDGEPILLKNQVVLSGNSITSASASFGQDGRPTVNISVSGSDVSFFTHVTARNVGQRMGIVYIETKAHTEMIKGKKQTVYTKSERVISAPVIQSALGSNFQITGLESQTTARNLALLLRAGALIAPINIVESRIVGPSLGKENIRKGELSLVAGLILVVLFMAFYYRFMGLIADIGLVVNLVLLVAVLSVVGAVLTLPGIAGIVLTLGMAVDANVLINERIREEMRNGMSIQAAIHAGYSRAMTTIVDANLTTMIVALVLFAIGTGAVKGFAVTTTIGLLTSMLSGVVYTRAVVNLVYGGRQLKRISIGI